MDFICNKKKKTLNEQVNLFPVHLFLSMKGTFLNEAFFI